MNDDDALVHLATGPLAAILLGAALIPLREWTAASNLTFAFLALTFLIGELGGRLPALATAVVSALSLDFFLTRPYLRLAIEDKNDVLAFFGLAACGLLAAFLGAPRREREASRRWLALVEQALQQLEAGGSVSGRAQLLADRAVAALPLAAAVVRDGQGKLLAAAGPRDAVNREPASVVAPGELALAAKRGWWQRTLPLPAEGIRLPLVVAGRPVGSLDVWGDGRRGGHEMRRALAAHAVVLGAILDANRPAQPGREPAAWTVGSRGSGA
jgi:K+-sensing histidine kinase KdpD